MKVFYLLEYPLEINGGAQLSTLNTAKELKKEYNVDTFILTPGYEDIPGFYENIDVNIIKLKSCYYRTPDPVENPIKFFNVKREIESLINAHEPNIVHSQMPLSFIYNALIKNKVIKIHTDRGLYTGYSNKSKLVYKVLIHKIDKLITTTFFNYNLWPISIDKKTCIYNTISEEFDSYDDEKYISLRKKYKIPSDMIVIGFTGRFTYFKNWPFILNLINKLVDNRVSFYLFISFAINSNNLEEVEDLKRFKNELYRIKKEHITLFQDLNQKEMSDFYYPLDVFIVPSVFESFGKVAVEAMARKCCVLSSNVGGLPEVVGNDEFILNLDVDKFYRKIFELIDNNEKLKKSKEYFFHRYAELFIHDLNTRDHFKLYSISQSQGMI